MLPVRWTGREAWLYVNALQSLRATHLRAQSSNEETSALRRSLPGESARGTNTKFFSPDTAGATSMNVVEIIAARRIFTRQGRYRIGGPYVSTVEDPARFARSRSVGAHLGLTPRQYQSGEVDRSGAKDIEARRWRTAETVLPDDDIVLRDIGTNWRPSIGLVQDMAEGAPLTFGAPKRH